MRFAFFILVLFALGSEAKPLVQHEASQRLLSRKPLCLTVSGRVNLDFDHACSILRREDLLLALQKSYAAGLPKDEEPEFTILQTSPTVYYYKNLDDRETTVEIVAVQYVPETNITVSLYSEGRRFFGNYQSLCTVEVVPIEGNQVKYHVVVHVHPESMICRFFTKVTPVETYFRHKIHEMTDLIVNVCDRIPPKVQEGHNDAISSF